jgi:glycosyltransferase involved in cell wall biosynthesis
LEICVLNPFFYPYKGGTERVILEVYKRLAKKHNITVITSAPLEKNRHYVEEIEGIKVVRLRTLRQNIPIFPAPFLLFVGLKKAIKKEAADIYHINNRYQYFEDSVLAIKSMDKKIALTIHNALPINIDHVTDELGEFYDWLWGRKLMKISDVITGVSTNTIETTVPRAELHKTHLIFNGVDYHKFKKISKSNDNVKGVTEHLDMKGERTIVSNGRLVTQKGHKYLIKAFSQLVKKEHMDLNLLLIGDGQLKSTLYGRARIAGVRDRFKIVKGIGNELPYYYNTCDAFSLPSLYEPAGLALLEAMSCELPSVISNIGGMPEMAGNCGIYTEPKDYRGIKEKLIFALENEKEVKKIVKRGRERVIKYHDWDDIAKKYEKLFSGIIKY